MNQRALWRFREPAWQGVRIRVLALTFLASGFALLAVTCGASPAATPTVTPVPAPTPTATVIPTPTPATVTLPADDGAHDVGTEWWYFNGHLTAANGRKYGFHEVFFKLQSKTLGVGGLLAQSAIIDDQAKTFTPGQQFAVGVPPQPVQGFNLTLGDWAMSGYDGQFQIRAALGGDKLSLSLTAEKPPVKQGGTGLVDFGAAGKSYYYSYPLLIATGTLAVDGQPMHVSGEAWLDHQWGDFHPADIGWDWFSLQLNNGTELMFFNVRNARGDTVQRFGTFVAKDGTYESLAAQDVELQPTGSWTSPVTGDVYPMGWHIAVPKLGIAADLQPVVKGAEMTSTVAGVPTYWEGEVTISGATKSGPVGGRGYVELVGYGPAASTSTTP